MEDLPVRLADLLESIAIRVRTMTVDRVHRIVKIVSLGLIALTMAVAALVYLFVALYNLLAQWLTPAAALGVMAGIFLIAGLLVWIRRSARPPKVELPPDVKAATTVEPAAVAPVASQPAPPTPAG
jgi:apolipoprotein N-acyltransferase